MGHYIKKKCPISKHEILRKKNTEILIFLGFTVAIKHQRYISNMKAQRLLFSLFTKRIPIFIGGQLPMSLGLLSFMSQNIKTNKSINFVIL